MAAKSAEDEKSRKYLEERGITELLQALTVGLIRHRPEDHLDFLQSCLDEVKDLPSDRVSWDTFLSKNPQVAPIHSRSPLNGSVTLLDGVTNNNESVQLTKHPLLPQVPSSQDLESEARTDNSEMSRPRKRPRRLERFESPSTSVTTSTNGHDFAGRSLNMASEVAGETGPLPRPPLLAVTGRTNTMLEFDESMFRAAAEDEDDTAEQSSADASGRNQRRPADIDEKTLRVLEGSFKDLPPRPTSTVRIFLSSTFSDFKAERNMLSRLAYPPLITYCHQKDLDFQVVDMRWGVTDDVINDHQVSQLCINEIVTCQQISCGPNFVVLLGNRYGYQPFPARIAVSEFETLRLIAEDAALPGAELLTDWFVKDDNVVPPEYILQPIMSRLEFYYDNRDEFRQKRKADQASWTRISDALRHVLRAATRIARERGVLSAEREHAYHISVTEEEISQGIFRSDSPNEKVLCYQRSLEGLIKEEIDQDAPKYIDLNDKKELDRDAETRRHKLVSEKLPNAIDQENIKTYAVPWKGKALENAKDQKDDEYISYLHNFCRDFVEDMKKLVDKNVEYLRNHRKGEVEGFYEEVLHHSQFAKSKCELFCGRETEIELIKQYLQSSEQERRPFIIHTKSGYGKTALMAHVSSRVHEWLGDGAVLILRFLGTSPQSSSIVSLLSSIVRQICVVYGLKVPADSVMEMFSDARRCLWSVLKSTRDVKPLRPLVLVLDAVDQLQDSYGAYEFLWLMRTLPPNVSIIVSMLSDRHHLVKNVQARLGLDAPLLELPLLPESTGAEIVDCYLKTNKRLVTPEQKQLVLSAFERNRQALFLKLILDQAKTWNSYTPVATIRLATTVHKAITFLFENLEVTYGKVFIQNALGYLTCGRGGLSPLEMEDILSCDNDCMSDVYQYHDPPLEGVVRLPSLMWSRVQHALREYLTERQVDGKTVMAWYHRQFVEASEMRFLKPDSRKQKLHFALSELFMQEEGITKTVILHHRNGKVIENADRCVTPQPLNVKNKRKLHALPHHLLHSGRKEPLKKQCLLNFDFLLIKLKAVQIGALFNEYRDMAECKLLAEEEDVKLFLDLLQLCYNALTWDPNLFAFHVKECLKSCSQGHPLLQILVQDAEAWIETSNALLLLPVNQFKVDPADSPLKFSILIGYDGKLTRDEEHLVCYWCEATSNVNKINIINLKTKDIVASVTTDKPTPVAITNDDKRFIFGDDRSMRVCEISSGDKIKRFPHLENLYEKVTVRCICLSHSGKYAVIAIRCGRPKAKESKNNKWKQTTHIILLDMEQFERKTEVEYHGSKHPEKVYFVNNDSQILVSAKDKISVFSVPDLQVKQVQIPFHVNSQAQKLVEDHNLLFSAVSHGKEAKVCLFNYQYHVLEYSKDVHPKIMDKATPFGLCVNEDASVVLVGVSVSTPAAYEDSVCVWDRKANTYSHTFLTHQPYKSPSSLQVHPSWSYALVGWSNGYLAVVDLQNQKEISVYQAHGHAVYNITFLEDGKQFITMSQDHCLKLWDSERQIKKCQEEYVNAQQVMEIAETDNVRLLDETEESMELDALDDCVVTVKSDHSKGPHFWNLEDGTANEQLTEAVQAVYKESLLENHNPDADAEEPAPPAEKVECTTDGLPKKINSLNNPQSGKTHGSVCCQSNGVLVYERKRRDFIATWAFSLKDRSQPEVLGQYASRAFLRCISPVEGASQQQKYFLVKNGELEVLSFPELIKEFCIGIPKISDEISDISTGAGKKKLMYYKVAVTVNCKKLIITDPAMGKFFDLVDLEKREYVKRYPLAKYVKWNLLDTSFCFLVEVEEDGVGIYPASKLTKLKDHMVNSKVLVHSEKFLSVDRKIGFEIINHAILVWQLEPLKKLHELRGHVHEVTSLSVSRNNQYLATGSYDNTARVWSLMDGTPLCMFHAYGAIDKVALTPSLSHLVLQCYAAPQRKRGAILRIKNQDMLLGKSEIQKADVVYSRLRTGASDLQ